MKICTKCKIEKPFECFSKDSTKKDKLHTQCKTCKWAYQQAYRERNREKMNAWHRQYRIQNKEKISAKRRKHYRDNKEKIKARHKQYQRKRRANDPLFRLSLNCRRRINMFMKASGFSKKAKTTQMLGVIWQDLKLHLESQFKDGMSWDNYGEWHVDHVIPLSRAMSGALYSMEELCHYTNLQPLWAVDNLQKSDS